MMRFWMGCFITLLVLSAGCDWAGEKAREKVGEIAEEEVGEEFERRAEELGRTRTASEEIIRSTITLGVARIEAVASGAESKVNAASASGVTGIEAAAKAAEGQAKAAAEGMKAAVTLGERALEETRIAEEANLERSGEALTAELRRETKALHEDRARLERTLKELEEKQLPDWVKMWAKCAAWFGLGFPIIFVVGPWCLRLLRGPILRWRPLKVPALLAGGPMLSEAQIAQFQEKKDPHSANTFSLKVIADLGPLLLRHQTLLRVPNSARAIWPRLTFLFFRRFRLGMLGFMKVGESESLVLAVDHPGVGLRQLVLAHGQTLVIDLDNVVAFSERSMFKVKWAFGAAVKRFLAKKSFSAAYFEGPCQLIIAGAGKPRAQRVWRKKNERPLVPGSVIGFTGGLEYTLTSRAGIRQSMAGLDPVVLERFEGEGHVLLQNSTQPNAVSRRLRTGMFKISIGFGPSVL